MPPGTVRFFLNSQFGGKQIYRFGVITENWLGTLTEICFSQALILYQPQCQSQCVFRCVHFKDTIFAARESALEEVGYECLYLRLGHMYKIEVVLIYWLFYCPEESPSYLTRSLD